MTPTQPKPQHTPTRTISFKATKVEQRMIADITKRAVALALKYDIQYSGMTANMDITACHANGNPLRLADLLAADDFNFAHDVFGIRQHINRETGQLENCFVPRFSL